LTSALPWRNGIHPSYATWQTSSIVTIGKPSLVSIIEWIAKPEVDCRVGEGSYCTGKHSNDEIVVMKQIPFQYWAVVAFFICGLVLIGCGQDTSPVEQPDALAEKVDSVSVVSDRGGQEEVGPGDAEEKVVKVRSDVPLLDMDAWMGMFASERENTERWQQHFEKVHGDWFNGSNSKVAEHYLINWGPGPAHTQSLCRIGFR